MRTSHAIEFTNDMVDRAACHLVTCTCGAHGGSAGGLLSNANKGGNADGKLALKVAYIGLTCEPPIFVAKELGFYEEEGLDVELVKTDWKGLQVGLGNGNFHANHTLLMYIMKPIESGVDVKITGGIHTGCLRIQAGLKSDI